MQSESESIGWSLAFEFTPAVIFGSAVGLSAARLFALPFVSIAPVATGAASFGLVWLMLRNFGSSSAQFPMHEFEQPQLEIELSAVGELLEEADVVALVEQLGASAPAERANELVLDDVLAAIELDSRVVSLFEPNDTAGKMQARIDDHLRSAPRQIPPDATQELHDALAALRRSLR